MARNAAANSAIPPPISASTRIAGSSTAFTRCGSAAVREQDQVRLDGVASFGRRPTFDNGAPLLEIFLFDFKGDLYGTTLDVAFIGFIRDELKFDSVEALVRQMDDDSARARAALAAAPACVPEARGDRPLLRLNPLRPRDACRHARRALRFRSAGCYGKPMFARRTISISGPASA